MRTVVIVLLDPAMLRSAWSKFWYSLSHTSSSFKLRSQYPRPQRRCRLRPTRSKSRLFDQRTAARLPANRCKVRSPRWQNARAALTRIIRRAAAMVRQIVQSQIT